MSTRTQDGDRRNRLSVRQRQKQLGRGLRLLYEQVLHEPIPADMIDALHAAQRAEAMQGAAPYAVS